MSSLLKSEGPETWPKLARKLSQESNFERAMLGTTTAVDVINGGVKINALTEVVTALVNFRIDFDESIEFAKSHVEGLLKKVAKHLEMPFEGFEAKNGTGLGIRVELVGEALEPAPRTPAEGPVWELFAGTVKYALLRSRDSGEVWITDPLGPRSLDRTERIGSSLLMPPRKSKASVEF